MKDPNIYKKETYQPFELSSDVTYQIKYWDSKITTE